MVKRTRTEGGDPRYLGPATSAPVPHQNKRSKHTSGDLSTTTIISTPLRQRTPRKAPRKEKRSDKRARLDLERQDREQAEKIRSVRQLQQLIVHSVTAGPEADAERKKGIHVFRLFLQLIAENSHANATHDRKRYLREYLEFETQHFQDAQAQNQQYDEYFGDEEEQQPTGAGDGKKSNTYYFLNDIINTWILSSRRNNEPLFALCARAIADLADILLQDPDLTAHGITLVKSLLDPQPVRLLSRGLAAPKYKHSQLVPCLKVLVSMATMANGQLVEQIYRRKDALCEPKTMSKILSTYRSQIEERRNAAGKLLDDSGDEDGGDDDDDTAGTMRRAPDEAARVYGVKYLTALIRYGDLKLKSDLLKRTNIFRSLFEYVKFDQPSLLRTLLKALRINIILDKTLLRKEKSQIFTDKNLSGLLVVVRNGGIHGLDQVDGQESHSEPQDEILTPEDRRRDQLTTSETALDFLQFVCVSPLAGVLPTIAAIREADYENQTAPVVMDDRDAVEPGMEPLVWPDDVKASSGSALIPEGNMYRFQNIIGFANSLKPHASVDECNLLLEMFRLIPVLVTQYFRQGSSFPFDPKLSASWIGYASFLFKVVQLPLPSFDYLFRVSSTGESSLGLVSASSHPSANALAQELAQLILPGPLTAASLAKCFNSTSDIVILFVVRILVLAMQKLEEACLALDDAARGPAHSLFYYTHVKSLLQEEVTKRCPDIKVVVTAFRRTSPDRLVMHEAVSRLLSLYYRTSTQAALLEQFDISLIVAQKLQLFQGPFNGTEEDRQFHLVTLGHLIYVARCSQGFQWWNRSDKLGFSPYVSLLRIVVANAAESESFITDFSSFKETLSAISFEHGIFQSAASDFPLDSLIFCLAEQQKAESSSDSGDTSVLNTCYTVLDECLNRLVRKACKYQDDLNALVSTSQATPSPQILSPLIAVLVEQWPFILKNHADDRTAETLSRWVCRFIECLRSIGESGSGLDSVLSKMKDASKTADRKSINKIFSKGKKGGKDSESVLTTLRSEIVAFSASSQPSTRPSRKSASKPQQTANQQLTTSQLLAEYASVAAAEREEDADERLEADTNPIRLGTLTINRASHFGPEKDSFPELFRWKKKSDPETALEDGDIDALFYCLCSSHGEIRKQAFDQLIAFGRVLSLPSPNQSSSSSFKQRDRILTLIGEAMDTAKLYLDRNEPTPYTLASFVVHAIPILARPGDSPDWLLQFIYRVLARTLKSETRVWELDRLPSQLVHRLLLDAPVDLTPQQLVQQQRFRIQHFRGNAPSSVPRGGRSNFGSSYHFSSSSPSSSSRSSGTIFSFQVGWLLDFFLQSLQSPADVASFDAANLFERIMCIYSSPFSDDRIRARVLAIVYRVAHVPGGAAILVTRYGTSQWLKMVRSIYPSSPGEDGSETKPDQKNKDNDRDVKLSVLVDKVIAAVRENCVKTDQLVGDADAHAKAVDSASQAQKWYPNYYH